MRTGPKYRRKYGSRIGSGLTRRTILTGSMLSLQIMEPPGAEVQERLCFPRVTCQFPRFTPTYESRSCSRLVDATGPAGTSVAGTPSPTEIAFTSALESAGAEGACWYSARRYRVRGPASALKDP